MIIINYIHNGLIVGVGDGVKGAVVDTVVGTVVGLSRETQGITILKS